MELHASIIEFSRGDQQDFERGRLGGCQACAGFGAMPSDRRTRPGRPLQNRRAACSLPPFCWTRGPGARQLAPRPCRTTIRYFSS